jgi:hypothetical protein
VFFVTLWFSLSRKAAKIAKKLIEPLRHEGLKEMPKGKDGI